MGWKSGKTITRNEALQIAMARLINSSDSELERILDSMGFGEDTELPYYGYNLSIGEVVNESEEE